LKNVVFYKYRSQSATDEPAKGFDSIWSTHHAPTLACCLVGAELMFECLHTKKE